MIIMLIPNYYQEAVADPVSLFFFLNNKAISASNYRPYHAIRFAASVTKFRSCIQGNGLSLAPYQAKVDRTRTRTATQALDSYLRNLVVTVTLFLHLSIQQWGLDIRRRLLCINYWQLTDMQAHTQDFCSEGVMRPGKLWHFKTADITFTLLNHALFYFLYVRYEDS